MTVTLAELHTTWTIDDLEDANQVLNALEEAEIQAARNTK